MYSSQARYTIADLGRSLRTGGSAASSGSRFRGRCPHALRVSYGGEIVSFGNSGLLGEQKSIYGNNSFRSTVGATIMRDTRVELPFPTSGGMQSMTAQFTGGPLGGTYTFQRYTAETRAYAPLGQIGGKAAGSQPMHVRARTDGAGGCGDGQHGSVLLLAGVRARRRAIWRAAPRLRRVLHLA